MEDFGMQCSLASLSKRPMALESSALRKLPLELILQILEYLTMPSAMSFTVSCMRIKCFVGVKYNQYLQALANNPSDRNAFLSLLARDLPNEIVCSPCQKLHKMEDAPKYMITSTGGQNGMNRNPRCVHHNVTVGYYLNWNFSSAVFQMAMKRYQQDSSCTRLLNLLSFNPPPWNPDTFAKASDLRVASQTRTECRIIQGLMLHRTQIAIPSLTPETSYIFTKRPSEFICPHMTFATDFTDPHTAYVVREDPLCHLYPSSKDYDPIWKAKLGYFTAPAKDIASTGLLSCQRCYTECRIEYKHYPGQGVILFVTKWKNLGTGPEDEEWTKHFDRHWSFSLTPKPREKIITLSEAFEGGEDLQAETEVQKLFELRDCGLRKLAEAGKSAFRRRQTSDEISASKSFQRFRKQFTEWERELLEL